MKQTVKRIIAILIVLAILLAAAYFMYQSYLEKNKDEEAPVITLKGEESMTLVVGDEYVEPGFTAADNKDGDITDKVWTEGSVDTSKAGTYHISYYAQDQKENLTRVRRTVTVLVGAETLGLKEFDLNPYYADVICKETPYDEDKYNDIYFYGDSFIGRLAIYGIIPDEKDWTRGDGSSDEVFDRLVHINGWFGPEVTFDYAMTTYNPKTVVVLLNNTWTLYWTPEYGRTSLDKLYSGLVSTYPDTNFVICAIPPQNHYTDEGDFLNTYGFQRNDRINKFNVVMCDLCRKYGLKFLNVAEVLKDEDGHCKMEYVDQYDYFHLNEEGFNVMVDYIKSHMDW